MSVSGGITIGLYEPWMEGQLVDLVCGEYGFAKKNYGPFLNRFYEHPYQREKSLRIVALDGRKVIGFQTFFYWPYLLDGKPVRSYQSGSSIVAGGYRGRGVFSRLLNCLDEIKKERRIDLLTGFPSPVSFNSFIRNRWVNVTDLDWYVRILSPLSLVRKPLMRQFAAAGSCITAGGNPAARGFTLSCDPEFEHWRSGYYAENRYFYLQYEGNGNRLQFDLKLNTRGWLKELIVGRIRTGCYERDFLDQALAALIQKAGRKDAFTFISAAFNSRYVEPEIAAAFIRAGFRRVKNKILFIAKDLAAGDCVYNPQLWQLYRSDVDTW